MRKPWIALALATIAVAGCHSNNQDAPTTTPPREAEVTVVTLRPETWTESIRAYGLVEAAEKVDLAADSPATVRAVHCREGATVSEGKAVVEFDNSARSLGVQQAKATIAAARVRLDQARKVADRQQSLFASGAIPREQLDQATAEVRGATAQLDGALAAQQLARHQLSKSVLLSPVTGVVTRRGAEPGEAVMPGQSLCTIQVVNAVRVVTYVTEREIGSLRVGEQFKVRSPGAPGHEFVGRVESLAAEADPRTGNFPVKLAVPNQKGLLRPGMAARVELRGVERGETLLVPATALVDRRRRRVAFRVVDGKAQRVQPVIAASTGDRLPVLRGLEAGDRVIVSGLDLVTDGTPVKVLQAAAPTSSSGPGSTASGAPPATDKPAPSASVQPDASATRAP